MRWAGLAAAEPGFAELIQARFGHHRHCLIATLRLDGAPRLSGIETWFWEDDLMLGMMPNSLKAADLRRDPRFELHSAPTDIHLVEPDARLWGRAVPIVESATVRRFAASLPQLPDEHAAMDLFAAEIRGALLTRVDGDRLVFETWRPDAGLTRHSRR